MATHGVIVADAADNEGVGARRERLRLAELADDLGISRLVLKPRDKKGKPLNIGASITDGSIERTIESASTVSLIVYDPDWAILDSGMFDRGTDGKLDRIDINLDDHWYRLVQVASNDDQLTLTFEDRAVAILKTFKGGFKNHKASEKFGHAEFARMLVKEANNRAHAKIKFAIHGDYQPVDKKKKPKKNTKHSKSANASKTGAGSSGLASLNHSFKGDNFVMSGIAVRRVMELAGFTPREAWIMNVIAGRESGRKPGVDATNGDGGIGLVQNTPYLLLRGGQANWGPEAIKYLKKIGGVEILYNPFGNALMARYLYLHGGLGHWSATAGEQIVPPNTKSALTKADIQWKNSGGLKELGVEASASSDGGAGKLTRFAREKNENSWTAIQRVAGLVGWRAFMDRGTLFYISEEYMFTKPAAHTFHRRSAVVQSFSFDWDRGKKVGEASIIVFGERWAGEPGTTVNITQAGPANGVWIVTSVRRSLFDNLTEISLKNKPVSEKKPREPVKSESNSPGNNDGGGGQVQGGAIPGSPVPGMPVQNTTHETSGLPGYPASDYMCPAGTPCVAPVAGKITRLSGSPPGSHCSPGGACGHSIYLSGGGKSYFLTHLDHVQVSAGQSVKQGEQIAEVADGPASWSSPHVHMGVHG